MTERRAPEGGYDFGAKREYRRQVWASFRKEVADPKNAHVFLMPSKEGAEIEEALRRGFQLNNMHVCDYRPAIVAVLNARYGGKLNTYGCSAGRACERIAEKGVRIVAANFDFTSCASIKLRDELDQISASNVLADEAVTAFTILRGREGRKVFSGQYNLETGAAPLDGVEDVNAELEFPYPEITECVTRRRPTVRDTERIAFLALNAFPQRWGRMFRVGVYLSPRANQTMLWLVSRSVNPHKVAYDLSNLTVRERSRYMGRMERLYSAATISRTLAANPDVSVVVGLLGEPQKFAA